MRAEQTFYFIDRWLWFIVGGLIAVALAAFSVPAFLAEPEDPINLFLLLLPAWTLLVCLTSPRQRLEIHEDFIYLRRTAFFRTRVAFADIEYVEQKARLWDVSKHSWFGSLRCLSLTFLPIGSGLLLKLGPDTRPWFLPRRRYEWILFRVGDTAALLSTLEAAGVPVRKLDS